MERRAQTIFDAFIETRKISVEDSIRDQIQEAIDEGRVPRSLFDDAVAACTQYLAAIFENEFLISQVFVNLKNHVNNATGQLDDADPLALPSPVDRKVSPPFAELQEDQKV